MAPAPGGTSVLAAATWPEVAGRAGESLLAVPVGSTEQHGPHLPLGTDAAVAEELCRRLARSRPDVMVAPTVAYGASGEHAGFPGTLSIGTGALERLLVELGRSADAFAGLLFVSAHGGNAVPLSRAVRQLRSESRSARSWQTPMVPDGDAHAGRTETSVMMALCGAAVHADEAAAGATADLGELMAAIRAGGVLAVSPNGVLGDPAGASAEAGEALLADWAADLARAVSGWP